MHVKSLTSVTAINDKFKLICTEYVEIVVFQFIEINNITFKFSDVKRY
jgi:hypothetical protein